MIKTYAPASALVVVRRKLLLLIGWLYSDRIVRLGGRRLSLWLRRQRLSWRGRCWLREALLLRRLLACGRRLWWLIVRTDRVPNNTRVVGRVV